MLLSLAAVALLATAQTPEDLELARQTQARGYWVNPVTRLMWAGKDNHKNVRWSQAKKYCRNLRLAGYQGWRLPTIEELYGIYDRSVSSPGLAGKHDDEPFAYHVRGGLFLTGDEWSSTERLDNNGHPIGFAAYFDFTNGPSQFHGRTAVSWVVGTTATRSACVGP